MMIKERIKLFSGRIYGVNRKRLKIVTMRESMLAKPKDEEMKINRGGGAAPFKERKNK